MIDPTHLLRYIIRPVLKDLGLWSPHAERLLLGTACKESECGRWLKQIGGGPALGIYQMEPATHEDIWDNFLEYKPELTNKLKSNYDISGKRDFEDQLPGNLYYATAMCRIHYLRVPSPIPAELPGQAAYWKKYYNTELGAGTVEEYISAWQQIVSTGVV